MNGIYEHIGIGLVKISAEMRFMRYVMGTCVPVSDTSNT